MLVCFFLVFPPCSFSEKKHLSKGMPSVPSSEEKRVHVLTSEYFTRFVDSGRDDGRPGEARASNEELIREELKKELEGVEKEENKANLKMKSDENSAESTDGSGQCSPLGVLEIPISVVHSDDGSNNVNSSSETPISQDVRVLESHNSQRRSLIGGLLLRKSMSIRRLSTFPPSSRGSFSKRKNLVSSSCKDESRTELAQQEIPMRRLSWRNFDYQELVVATNNFSHENLIGKGGHAEVYKGCLPDGQLVAVKRLTKRDKEDERIGYFLSELGIIAHVNHPNAAQLLGFSTEGGLHMVLQFSPHGSLASILHGSKEGLKWKVRFDISLKIAEGLCYLHEGCQRRIIHRDIKPSNILLTEDYQPQISDFGLAKWLPDKWTHHLVFPIEGTFGYMAPEYFMHGVVNEKTDVFAFGVLLLELLTGRRAVDSFRKSLVIWAKPFLDANDFNGLADPSFGDDADPEELKLTASVASMCIHHISTCRPNMNTVVQLLRGEVGTHELMGRASKPRLPLLFDACDLQDYTCSSYLTDLLRHKQLALEQ